MAFTILSNQEFSAENSYNLIREKNGDSMMKTLTARILSFILTLSMMLGFLTTAFAYSDETMSSAMEEEDTSIFCEIFEDLSPEARAIFEESLVDDPTLLAIHTTYVNPEFSSHRLLRVASTQSKSSDPVKDLNAKLKNLGLSSEVSYALKAMAAGMVAAASDGPLPVGDIIAAATMAKVVKALGSHWDDVLPKWGDVLLVFQKAFAASKQNIKEAFGILKKDIASSAKPKVSIQVKGNKVRVNNKTYVCALEAEKLEKNKFKNAKYLLAYLDHNKGQVYVSPTPMDTAEAKIIMMENHSQVGVWAMKESYARGLCGGASAISHPAHGNEGYFPHYHHPMYKNFHCWYSNLIA